MEKLTVYGLPLNPMPLLKQVADVAPAKASFCVSYFTRDKLGKQLDQAIELVGQDGILLVDNGAFSAFKAGRTDYMQPDYIEAFGVWANEILDRCPQAIAVIPDVIGGTLKQNAELVEEYTCLVNPDRAMPIWHTNEPISYLLNLCEDFNYVGIGSAPAFEGDPSATPGSREWHARMTEVFAAIDAWELDSEGAYIRPRIHLMRAQAEAHKYAVDSSDSTNVAVNHNRQARKGEPLPAFAARINGKIQASAGAPSEHQIKRPQYGWVALQQMHTELWLLNGGYDILEPVAVAEGKDKLLVVRVADDRIEAIVHNNFAQGVLVLKHTFTGADDRKLAETFRRIAAAGEITLAHWEPANRAAQPEDFDTVEPVALALAA